MPKSKHRKKHKKKSRLRTESIQAKRRGMQKKLEEEFRKQIEELRNKALESEKSDS
jgi:hypothetical protein